NLVEAVADRCDSDAVTCVVDEQLTLQARMTRGVSRGVPVTLSIRPEKIRISGNPESGGETRLNVLPGVVKRCTYAGVSCAYDVEVAGGVNFVVRQSDEHVAESRHPEG